ncbi:MAG: DUF4625 domain-containing protein [Prevotellaceae bacterium]|jgi:hypothetical protein|nr:DUF4625 domain-containing protein [Prevotellaceae bacterium]
MNTKNKFFTVCLAATFLFTLYACENENNTAKGDTTKPVIDLIEPAESDILQIGDENGVHFEAEFSDDEMLASYKVDIHPNFDNHGHASIKSTAETVDFQYEKAWNDISGRRNASIHHHEIKIPENATPGRYHLMVYCIDAAGNEEHIAVNIELSHNAGEDHDHEHDHDDD